MWRIHSLYSILNFFYIVVWMTDCKFEECLLLPACLPAVAFLIAVGCDWIRNRKETYQMLKMAWICFLLMFDLAQCSVCLVGWCLCDFFFYTICLQISFVAVARLVSVHMHNTIEEQFCLIWFISAYYSEESLHRKYQYLLILLFTAHTQMHDSINKNDSADSAVFQFHWASHVRIAVYTAFRNRRCIGRLQIDK